MHPPTRWEDPDTKEHCAECMTDEGLTRVYGVLRCERHGRDVTFEVAAMRQGEDVVSAMERTR